MKRCAVITAWIIVLAGAMPANAQDKVPLGTLFTISVPLNFQAVNMNMSHVAVRCELRGYLAPEFGQGDTKVATSDFRSVPIKTFVTKGAPPNLILFPLSYRLSTDPALGTGGSYQGTATIAFASNDFALNPPGLNDPSLVTEIYCQFAFRGKDGLLYQPSFDPAYVRSEIDNFRMSVLAMNPPYVGRVQLTQPPVTSWPPALAPFEPTKRPYQWHAAWILPLPQWLRYQ